MNKIDYITCFTDIEFLGFPLSIYEKLKSKNINKLNDILICKLSDLEEIFTEEEINCIKERCEVQGYKLEHDYTNYGPKKKPVSIYKIKENNKKSKKKKEETDKKEECEEPIFLDAYDLTLALYNKKHY
jgi:hypothetical protein